MHFSLFSDNWDIVILVQAEIINLERISGKLASIMKSILEKNIKPLKSDYGAVYATTSIKDIQRRTKELGWLRGIRRGTYVCW